MAELEQMKLRYKEYMRTHQQGMPEQQTAVQGHPVMQGQQPMQGQQQQTMQGQHPMSGQQMGLPHGHGSPIPYSGMGGGIQRPGTFVCTYVRIRSTL